MKCIGFMVKIPPVMDIKGIGMLFLRPYLQVNGDCRTFAGKENGKCEDDTETALSRGGSLLQRGDAGG